MEQVYTNIVHEDGIKVLSLFDGMSCGMLALIKAGIKVSRYIAFEVDVNSIKTSNHNFPFIEHRGDVMQADFSEFLGFDLLFGGSPCTYWSRTKKNRDTDTSGMGWELFCKYVSALEKARPRFFIYENNKSMPTSIRDSITKAFGFEPVCINSSLVSAQNRERLYWVGERMPDGTYRQAHIDQPRDKGIRIINVLNNIEEET